MEKISRNEPCYCGSGLKYKRCCLEKDQANARLQSALLSSGRRGAALSEQDIHHMIDAELEWKRDPYRLLALELSERMRGEYEESIIVEAIALWHRFSSDTEPSFRKSGIHCAAMEYAVSEANGLARSQSELAEKYGISSTSLSKRYAEINDFIETKLSGKPADTQPILSLPEEQAPAFDMELELAKLEQAVKSFALQR